MRASAVEKLVWILIYGGLLLLSLGLFVRARAAALGLGMILAGGLLACSGAVLIIVRSRMKE